LVEKNTTIEWVKWIREIYQPEAMASGYFSHTKLLKVVKGGSDDGDTFALQFEIINKNKISEAGIFIQNLSKSLIPNQFGEKALYFITELDLQ
jgi:hypothetical protein